MAARVALWTRGLGGVEYHAHLASPRVEIGINDNVGATGIGPVRIENAHCLLIVQDT